MVIQTWTFAKPFLGNEQRELISSRKTTDSLVTP